MALDFAGMGDLVKQAQEMQKKVSEAQAQLAQKLVTATAGGGMVMVTANGASEVVSIKLEREVINPEEAEMLADLIVAAVNEALKKAQDLVAQEMSQITGGLNLPGLFGG
jgi:DNA-binding YbaB/EbfC family protein